MKKLNYLNLIFFIAIFFIILITSLAQPLVILDEMWNYNISKNIAEGLVPYKDISMITTPFFSMLTAIFLKCVSNEIIVTRIINAFMLMFILYFIYKCMQNIKVSEPISHLVIICLTFITRTLFTSNYNILLTLIGIIIIYLELRNRENIDFDFAREFFIGFFVGLAICTKQTIGILLFVGMFICNFIHIKKGIKLFLKRLATKCLGALLPVLILLIYLILNNCLYEFYDYCFLGINTFNNSESYIDFFNNTPIIFAKVLAIVCPIILIITLIDIIYKLVNKKECSNLVILLIYSIILLVGIYPIADYNHFITFMHPCFILIAYYIYFVISKFLKESKLIDILFIVVTVLITGILMYIGVCLYFNKGNTYNINHYRGIHISDSICKDIVEVDKFLLNNDAIILDSEAVMYMIPIDRYHKNYDMLNIGNFGSSGEEGIIEDLKTKKGYILILNDKYKPNWQVPTNIINCVKNNMNKVGTVAVYDIYKW